MKRFTLTVTKEIEKQVDFLKQQQFYNEPYSCIYRYLIEQGLETVKNKSDKNKAI